MVGDTISVESDAHEGRQLFQPVMKNGWRHLPALTLIETRDYARQQRESVPEDLTRLEDVRSYPVVIAPALRALARNVDQRVDAMNTSRR